MVWCDDSTGAGYYAVECPDEIIYETFDDEDDYETYDDEDDYETYDDEDDVEGMVWCDDGTGAGYYAIECPDDEIYDDELYANLVKTSKKEEEEENMMFCDDGSG